MIEIRDLRHEHSGAVIALRGVDLELREGSWNSLIGPNGSGKTTLARCLNGLLVPTAGSVTVDGLRTSDAATLAQVRRRVAMVFQHPDDQLVAPTVESEIAFGLENHGVEPALMRDRVDEVLTQFDLERYRSHPPHLLSGGERQRLAVASAVAVRPRYLVLDEPTALLDPRARRELVGWIGKLCRDHGLCVLHITQSPEEAARADRLLVLSEGRLVEDAPPRRVFAHGAHLRRIGLAPPFAVEVAEAAGGSATDALDLTELAAWLTRSFAPAQIDVAVPAQAGPAHRPAARLQAQRVGHVYRAGLPAPVAALRDVDLGVAEGELIGLVGANGSGKTTLAQHLNGLLRPTSGKVLFDGSDIWHDADAAGVRRHVGLVFQFPEAQLFDETVAADVAFGPRNHGCDDAEAARRSATALESVGLPVSRFGDRPPLSLSGGERRRAAIAGVLAVAPAILVLDEPTAGLDPHNEEVVVKLLQNLVSQGRGLVLISHDIDRIAELTSRLTVMDRGGVCWQGDTRSTLERAAACAPDRHQILEPPTALRLTIDLRSAGFPAPTMMTRAEACGFVSSLQPGGTTPATNGVRRESR